MTKGLDPSDPLAEAPALRAQVSALHHALAAVGAHPEGFCCCPGSRDATKPEPEHVGECREARAVLRDAEGVARAHNAAVRREAREEAARALLERVAQEARGMRDTRQALLDDSEHSADMPHLEDAAGLLQAVGDDAAAAIRALAEKGKD